MIDEIKNIKSEPMKTTGVRLGKELEQKIALIVEASDGCVNASDVIRYAVEQLPNPPEE